MWLGHQDIVQRLLDNKEEIISEVDAIDSNQQTPLHLACLRGNQKCVVSRNN